MPANEMRTRSSDRTAAGRVLVMLLVGLVLAGCNSAALPTAEPAPEPSPTTASAGLASGGRPGPTAPASAPPPMTPTAKPASPTPIPESPRPTRTRKPASPTSVAAPAVTPEPEPTATATVAGSVPVATATPTAAALPVQTRLDIFDKVWSTVNDTYLYADFGGVDWAGAQSRYEPRVRAVGSDEEFYTLVTEMVAELGDDHSRFLAPADARSEDALERGSADYVGVGIISSPG
ncbi:MAG TPA: hypothetical protein VFR15_08590, partial [Chloroflexia bacterium]|nr:hypothetical protein [Chloroflexia bacterium]